jgi:anthranilate 1,2-dioxygenase large subunit/terephthalate 1,2-dioxygenase oxygenase component alpha subunit
MQDSSLATSPPSILNWPELGVCRVPFQVFTDQALYDLEQDRLFRGDVWHWVGLEAETPSPGDFKANTIGDTPVLMIRDLQGEMKVFVNRCAHRGARLCIDNCGNIKGFTCVYHNWSYDLDGNLLGVAFRHGVNKQGGLPPDFDFTAHHLQRLRVDVVAGLVFATFSETVAPLRAWLGTRMTQHIERIFGRPIRILGRYTQYMHNNWKLYVENVKDSYHASLLHLFFTTFKLNRLTQEGAVEVSESGGHHISWSKMAANESDNTAYDQESLRANRDGFRLVDPRLLHTWPEFLDGVTHAIQTVFPNLVVQQIQNSLAVRLMVPKGVGECELQWILFGYAEDTPEQAEMRLMQSNLVGPAGLVSMEDGVVGHLIQQTIARDADKTAVLEMGGRSVESRTSRVSESSVRGFWQAYRKVMEL